MYFWISVRLKTGASLSKTLRKYSSFSGPALKSRQEPPHGSIHLLPFLRFKPLKIEKPENHNHQRSSNLTLIWRCLQNFSIFYFWVYKNCIKDLIWSHRMVLRKDDYHYCYFQQYYKLVILACGGLFCLHREILLNCKYRDLRMFAVNRCYHSKID